MIHLPNPCLNVHALSLFVSISVSVSLSLYIYISISSFLGLPLFIFPLYMSVSSFIPLSLSLSFAFSFTLILSISLSLSFFFYIAISTSLYLSFSLSRYLSICFLSLSISLSLSLYASLNSSPSISLFLSRSFSISFFPPPYLSHSLSSLSSPHACALLFINIPIPLFPNRVSHYQPVRVMPVPYSIITHSPSWFFNPLNVPLSATSVSGCSRVSISCVGEGGHVRIAKVQHALTKVLLEIGCLYLAIILSSYSRFIVPVKKLQFPT